MGKFLVLQADAARVPLPDESVDLIVTSPPYFSQRRYTDGGVVFDQVGAEPTPALYLDSLLACTKEWARVLKPEGSMFINLGDKYCGYTNGAGKGRSLSGERGKALVPDGPVSAPTAYGIPNKSLMALPSRYAVRCMDDLGLIFRRDIVWRKLSYMPEKVRDRCHTGHEYLIHLTRKPRYYADWDAISAFPSSVWDIASGSSFKVPEPLASDTHPAPFPDELPRRCVLGWCPPGGVVLDPFGGTGTAALLAVSLGRTGITVDLSRGYGRQARWRAGRKEMNEQRTR